MKRDRIYNNLLAAIALVGGMLSSCSNETEEIAAITDNGGYISFSVDGNTSRTMIDPSNPTTIKWVEGDTVTIYSPDCETFTDKTVKTSSHFAEYTVHIDADGTAKLNFNKYGLVWPSSKTTHPTCRFYAVQGPKKAFYTNGGKIETFDDGYLYFDTWDSPTMNRTQQTVDGEQYVGIVNPFLLAETTVQTIYSSSVSLNFIPYSSTTDFCITNLTGRDIRLYYIDARGRFWGYTKDSHYYIKWNIEKKTYEWDGDDDDWESWYPYAYFEPNDDSNYEPVILANNQKVHVYFSMPVYARSESLNICYYYIDTKDYENAYVYDLDSYTFEVGTINKLAIDITGK